MQGFKKMTTCGWVEYSQVISLNLIYVVILDEPPFQVFEWDGKRN